MNMHRLSPLTLRITRLEAPFVCVKFMNFRVLSLKFMNFLEEMRVHSCQGTLFVKVSNLEQLHVVQYNDALGM